MSWLPNFLNIMPAAIAAAIVIPALLVLYFLKLRRREMAVSSTLLWKKAVQDLQVNAPFQRLRRNLLLFLQLLLLALLLAALARPVMNYTPGAGSVTVVLIDRSASMSAADIEAGRTRLEEAKRQAKALIGTLDRNASAMVIAFDDSAQTVQPFTTDTAALRRAIDSIQPTDRPARLEMAYQLAEAQTHFSPEQLRPGVELPDVWLFSDGRAADAEGLSLRGNLRYHRIGTETADNVGIVALHARRNYERPTEVQVFARLANYGTAPVEADVQLNVDGRARAVARTFLLPDRLGDEERMRAERQGMSTRDSVEFTVEMEEAGVIRVEQMNRDGDVLAADDAAHVIVPPPRALKVLLVTEGNYFLERAIESLDLQRPDSMTPAAYERNVPTAYDVIIFDRHQPSELPPAGSFIYFGAVPGEANLKPAMEDEQVLIAEDARVLDWQRDHPILRHLLLGGLYAAEAIELQVPLESQVLMEGLHGPMIVLHREGRHTHLVVAFDLMQSNWPLRVSFPIFMHNALQFLAIGSEMDVRQAYAPGTAVRIPRANLMQAGEPGSVRLSGPMGTREIAVPQEGDFVLPPLERVGVYSLDPSIPQFERLAVNLLDENESNLLPADAPPGGIGETIAGDDGRTRLELWWWIVACAALPLLFIEWWVYTRRVHL